MNGNLFARFALLPVTLPLSMMAAGLQVMTRLLEDAGQPTAVPPPASPPIPPAPTPPAAPFAALPRPGAGHRSDDDVVIPKTAGDVVGPSLVTHHQEDSDMSSCGCDNDLSGCELKVIQYTIVTADPNPDINDSDRILSGPDVVATSDDLSDSSFTAWVIAKYLQTPGVKHPPHDSKQYLRVCYQVLCRVDMPCVNYQQQQAKQLANIAKVLAGDKPKDEKGLERRKK